MGKQKLDILISSLLIFSVAWIVFVIPWILNNQFFGINPLLHFPIVQLGFYGLSICLMYLYERLAKKSENFGGTILKGIYGWSLFSFVADMWLPPFAINQQGMINNFAQDSLLTASGDYFLYELVGKYFQSISLFGSSVAYLMVYVVIPIAILAMYLLFSKRRKND
jgi:hypothetical protein